MLNKVFIKIASNLSIYHRDIKTKGVYWSIIHRLYKIPKVKKFLSPIINYFKPEYLIIGGNKLFIDKKDSAVSQELILSGKWEEYETSIFKKNIKKGDVVLDIGAHIGYYTLIAAQAVGNEGKVYSFEPDPKNFALLKKNIRENRYRNVVPINMAVADKKGSLRLFLNEENTGDHRIYSSLDRRKAIKIRTVTLDDFFKDKDKRINMIKIDIQGSEVRAFKGGIKLIELNRKVKILTEFWPYGLRLSGSSAKEYADLLINNNFKLFNLEENTKKKTIIAERELLFLSDSDADNYRYLFCLRK